MIGQNLKSNQDKKPNSREMEKLKKEFPQFFTKDGEFRIDNFKDFLKEEEVELSKEGYGLEFLGKSYAKYLSSLESETYISPDLKHNEKDENKNSENLYIVGDNIDALKHLLGSYSGKIKCIYIDPPYNTGSDGFVYPDNFNFDSEELARTIGITEEEAERILNLSGKSTHSAWLTFIYPRLLLARDLLADDGVIFISIDDNEQANLKLICDEIFGEENLLTCVTRATGTPTGGGFDGLVNQLDYILIYSKNIVKTSINGLPMDEISAQIYNQEDEKGRYLIRSLRRTGGEDRKEDRPTMYYPMLSPDGEKIYPIGPTGYQSRWMCSKETAKKLEQEGLIEWKKTIINDKKIWHPYQKYYLADRKKKPGNIWKDLCYTDSGHDIFLWEQVEGNKKATIEIRNLFDEKVFDSPKSVSLLKKIITISLNKNDFILDFFSGSATTADALMQLNAEDGGKRKYIMVQIPEKIDKKKPAFKAGYKTIDEIGRERIKRAGKKIKNETGANIDYGFKLFYLEKPKEKTLDKLEEFSPQIKFPLDDMVSIFDNDHASGKENILSTWLNEDGYGLSQSSDEYVLDEYRANLIGKSLYIIDSGLGSSDVMELIRRIEDDSLLINRIVVYLHSINFSVLQELRTNLKVLRKNKNVSLIERF